MAGVSRVRRIALSVVLPLLASGGVLGQGINPEDWDFMYRRDKIHTPKAIESPFNFGQLKLGAEVPAVVLETQDGTPFNLREDFAGQAAMLVFFRSPW